MADDPRPRAELAHEIIEQLRWCEGQIGTSWLFDYNLPDLYRLLTELYATSTDANDGGPSTCNSGPRRDEGI